MFPPAMSDITITGPYPELGPLLPRAPSNGAIALRFAAVACKLVNTEQTKNGKIFHRSFQAGFLLVEGFGGGLVVPFLKRSEITD